MANLKNIKQKDTWPKVGVDEGGIPGLPRDYYFPRPCSVGGNVCLIFEEYLERFNHLLRPKKLETLSYPCLPYSICVQSLSESLEQTHLLDALFRINNLGR